MAAARSSASEASSASSRSRISSTSVRRLAAISSTSCKPPELGAQLLDLPGELVARAALPGAAALGECVRRPSLSSASGRVCGNAFQRLRETSTRPASAGSTPGRAASSSTAARERLEPGDRLLVAVAAPAELLERTPELLDRVGVRARRGHGAEALDAAGQIGHERLDARPDALVARFGAASPRRGRAAPRATRRRRQRRSARRAPRACLERGDASAPAASLSRASSRSSLSRARAARVGRAASSSRSSRTAASAATSAASRRRARRALDGRSEVCQVVDGATPSKRAASSPTRSSTSGPSTGRSASTASVARASLSCRDSASMLAASSPSRVSSTCRSVSRSSSVAVAAAAAVAVASRSASSAAPACISPNASSRPSVTWSRRVLTPSSPARAVHPLERGIDVAADLREARLERFRRHRRPTPAARPRPAAARRHRRGARGR